MAPGAIEAKLYLPSGEAATTPLVVKTGALEAGKSYTYNLIVGKDAVTIDDMTVAEWKPGETTGGEALERPDYLTFTADGGTYLQIKCTGEYVVSDLEYSVNFGEWKKWTASTYYVEFGGSRNLRLRGTNKYGTAESSSKYATFSIGSDNSEPRVQCTGDIRTLLDYTNYKNVDTGNARFCRLFYNCKKLTTAPKLPATKLADYCYTNMFGYCENLETAPDLPAKDLPQGCYSDMFYNCKNLVTGPKISATKMSKYSCQWMLINCPKLSSVTLLTPSDQMNAEEALERWLKNSGTIGSTRTLVVKDKAAYDELKLKSYLPSQWQIGLCTVQNESGSPITE